MGELIEGNFIKPYSQPSLNGDFGLTSDDMAKSLGKRHGNFRRALKNDGYLDRLKEAGLNFTQIRVKLAKRGRPGLSYVFPVETAKVVLAQSRTRIGLRYVQWLLKCEKAIWEMAEALSKERLRVNELLDENRTLQISQRKPRKHSINIQVVEKTIFGEEVIIMKKRDYLADMTENERRLWKSTHCARIAEGAAKSSKELQTFQKNPDNDKQMLLGKNKNNPKLLA